MTRKSSSGLVPPESSVRLVLTGFAGPGGAELRVGFGEGDKSCSSLVAPPALLEHGPT